MKPPVLPECLPYKKVENVTSENAREVVDYLKIMAPSLQVLFGVNFTREVLFGEPQSICTRTRFGQLPLGSCLPSELTNIQRQVGKLAT